MRKSTGTLHYSIEPDVGHKLVATLDDPFITVLARHLVPRYLNVKPQRWPPHISVIRKQTPVNLEAWGKYEGERVEFEYDDFIYNDETYFWYRAYCQRLIEIRNELGLEDYSWAARGPDNFPSFHITIGNTKP